uniref:Uncharacterized protein n=1 Tax=Arundo donax TaxID=35708 RepID=A0A0A9BMS3_ARUDO
MRNNSYSGLYKMSCTQPRPGCFCSDLGYVRQVQVIDITLAVTERYYLCIM